MPSPFQEDFSGCVEGQPVTSDNTVFEPVIGGGQSILNPNSTFETGLTGWAARFPETTVTWSSERAYKGSHSMEVTAEPGNDAFALSTAFPIEVKDEWWADGRVWIVSGVTRVIIRFYLYDSEGVFLDGLGVQAFDPPVGRWLWYRVGRSVIPGLNDTAAQARLEVEFEGDEPHGFADNVEFRYSRDSQLAQIASQARPALTGLGAWITEVDSGGAPWKDAGLFTDEVTGQRRLFFRSFVSVTDVTGPNLTYMWLSAPDNNAPVVSIGINSSEQLVGAGLTLASGSASLGTFLRWSRVDVVVTESGDDLLVTADIYSGINLYSDDPAERSGQLSGTIAGGAALLADGAWLWLGREDGTTPTSATVLVDKVSFDAVPQPADRHIMDPGPGFFVLRDGKMPRVELLGEWNGSSLDEVEFLGRWQGIDPIPDPGIENIDTLWLETWPVDGAIGSPWSVNGQALSVSDGRTVALGSAQRGRAVRAGPSGDAHFGALQAQISQTATTGVAILDVRMKDPGTATDESNDSYIRIGLSGSSAVGLATFTVRIQATGVNYAIITDIDYTQYYDLAVRLVGNEARGYVNRVLIGSYVLTSSDLADLGSSARLIIEGPATIGPLRAENL